MNPRQLGGLAFLTGALLGLAQPKIPVTDLQAIGATITAVSHEGRNAIRMVESDGHTTRRARA